MLHKIPLISAVLFSILYPLCFWISGRSPLRQQFHHFHTGLPCCVAGICAVWICSAHFPLSLKIHFCVWVLALLLLSASQWARAYADYRVMSLPSLIGISALCHLLGYWQPVTVLQLVILLLGGAIFCASLYAMNLGHWYLNVHGLPVRHLKIGRAHV